MGFSSAITNHANDLRSTIADFFYLHKKYQALKLENQLLRDNIALLQQLFFENEELRRLTKLTLPNVKKIASTRIISEHKGAYSYSAIISVGKEEGVALGHIAVNGDGMVGRVIAVGANSSRLLLLNDHTSKIPVFFPRSKEHAIAVGNGNSLLAQYLPQSAKILVGDIVLTSGDGAFFPYGLPIGKVSKVSRNEVQITPFYEQNKLNLVTIVSY